MGGVPIGAQNFKTNETQNKPVVQKPDIAIEAVAPPLDIPVETEVSQSSFNSSPLLIKPIVAVTPTASPTVSKIEENRGVTPGRHAAIKENTTL